MVEGTMAWVLLITGIISWDAGLLIASGVFAVALQIQMLREEKNNNV